MPLTHTYTVTPADIRMAWGKLMTGKRGARTAARQGHVLQYADTPEEVIEFAGMSGQQISDALANGYHPPEKDIIRTDARGFGEIMVPQILVNEDEGELLISEAIAGEEEYLARWQDQPEQRGVRIKVDIAFHCRTDAEDIGEFYAWILRMIEQFQRRGNAPAVDLMIRAEGVYTQQRYDQQEIVIPLVEEGEIIDPVTWRAFLTPGAFRTLGFLAMGIVAVREGLSTVGHLGYPRGDEFGVIYDDEDGVLEIVTPRGFSTFPEDTMTESLNRILERF